MTSTHQAACLSQMSHDGRCNCQPSKSVREWLFEYFGDSATNIEGIDNSLITGTVTKRPKVIADKGRLFLLCNGLAILGFSRNDQIRGSVYVVVNDDAGREWEAEKRSNSGQFTKPRPSERLMLVYSA